MHKSLPTLPEGASAAERYFSERYPGYRLKDYRTDPLTHTVSCFVLEPLDAAYRCPKCGTVASRFHDDRVPLWRGISTSRPAAPCKLSFHPVGSAVPAAAVGEPSPDRIGCLMGT